jgi:isoquinoline 1-oxidoreductase
MSNINYTAVEREWGMEDTTLDRREMVKLLGGGIFVLFHVAQSSSAQPRQFGTYPDDFNAFLRIGDDGRVSLFSGKIEMGQGIYTALAQMLGDELDVALDSIDMVMGDTLVCPSDMATVGSLSIRTFGPALRGAGAEARAVLLQLAGERLGVSSDQLAVEDGVVFQRGARSNSVSYAELAQGRRIERRLEGTASPKDAGQRRLCGTATSRTDSVPKVTGTAQYTGDVQLPGMLYARILRPPTHDAALEHLETSAAEAVDGAQVVRDGDLVAVLHEYPDVADRALALFEARWSVPNATVNDETIFDHLVEAAPPPQPVASAGNLDDGERLATQTFDHTYREPYLAHAPMEPHTAVAQVEGDRATVWAATQAPFWLGGPVSQALGIPSANVRVITPFVGGGFGGKTNPQHAVEAARLAKQAGRPVQVAWSRKEEFFYDAFQPASIINVRSGVDEAGRVVLWDYETLFAGSRGAELFYAIPHHQVVARGSWGGRGGGSNQAHPFAVGAWRGPGAHTNVFAVESQIDIMAAAAGMDPMTFRLQNLQNDRMRRVLEAAAEKFGRRLEPAPSGSGYGVACADYAGTYVATMVEVSVDRAEGTVQVLRVVCAQDMGEIINPEGATLQMEGCITMGLGFALSEQVRFDGRRVLSENFDTYEIPKFSWLPTIETVLVENTELPPSGGGEPPIATMGAVIANAIHDAVGVRLYELPMTPERISEALGEG